MGQLVNIMKRCEARTRGLTRPRPLFARGCEVVVLVLKIGLDRLGRRLAAEGDAAALGDAHAPLLARVQAEQALQEL